MENVMLPHVQNKYNSVPLYHYIVSISTPSSPFTLVGTSQAEYGPFAASRGERRGALGGLSDGSLSRPEQGDTGIWGEGSTLVVGVGTGRR